MIDLPTARAAACSIGSPPATLTVDKSQSRPRAQRRRPVLRPAHKGRAWPSALPARRRANIRAGARGVGCQRGRWPMIWRSWNTVPSSGQPLANLRQVPASQASPDGRFLRSCVLALASSRPARGRAPRPPAKGTMPAASVRHHTLRSPGGCTSAALRLAMPCYARFFSASRCAAPFAALVLRLVRQRLANRVLHRRCRCRTVRRKSI